MAYYKLKELQTLSRGLTICDECLGMFGYPDLATKLLNKTCRIKTSLVAQMLHFHLAAMEIKKESELK